MDFMLIKLNFHANNAMKDALHVLTKKSIHVSNGNIFVELIFIIYCF